ncbi:EAL domain-containing protein [Cryobacterium levicorallinum]|nr:EAL domain-containing protein [Cryobacterium levicorallinum]
MLDEPDTRILFALGGIFCVAALEIAWIRIGSVAHRSLMITLPVLALPALTPVLPDYGVIGIVMFGILVALLIESRRLDVSVYGAGLAGLGCLFFLLIDGVLGLVGVSSMPAVAAASVGYVAFVLTIEVVRISLAGAPAERGGRSLISPVRLGLLLITVAGLTMTSVHWSEVGLPTPGAGRTPTQTAAGVLLGTIVVAILAIVLSAMSDMRRRINGLVLGSSILSATRPLDSVDDVTEAPEPAAIGVQLSFTAVQPQCIVARRDAMDGAFTGLDRRALQALSAMAELVGQARRNGVGLTARASIDSLSGLPNYGAFQTALETINSQRGEDEAIAVLFIHIDAFKRLNDTYGHQAGDTVLQVVAQRMRQAVRPHDVVSRVGGDKFALILTRLSTPAEAADLANLVLAAATLPVSIGETVINPRVGIGLAFSERVEADVAELVLDADQSLLSVKKARRRGTADAANSIRVSAHRSSHVTAAVVRTIDNDELVLAYQPIVSLVSGEIWAFEALLRYVDPDFGAISPTALVQTAKRLDRFDLLTRQVAAQAMLAAAEFRLVEPAIGCMAINVDADQLTQDRLGGFFQTLGRQYPELSLCLELNERSAVHLSDAIREQIDRLRGSGILIALDDYGSEESSVDSLVRVPMDILKIDGGLIDDLEDIRQREVLMALQGFGDKLEYSMIVEGVENAQMAAQLSNLGIRSAQGFHFGIPQSFAETVDRLNEFGAQAVRRIIAREPLEPEPSRARAPEIFRPLPNDRRAATTPPQ